MKGLHDKELREELEDAGWVYTNGSFSRVTTDNKPVETKQTVKIPYPDKVIKP